MNTKIIMACSVIAVALLTGCCTSGHHATFSDATREKVALAATHRNAIPGLRSARDRALSHSF